MHHGYIRVLSRTCFILGLFSLAPLVASGNDFPLVQWDQWREQSSNRYPQDRWLQYAAPEEAGWSSDKLAKARRYFDEIDSAAVMVVHDGAVLAAWGDIERRYMCHSIRKSLLSALYGIHVSAGTIDLSKTLQELDINDEPPLTDRERHARVLDLLTSRSGVYHPAAYETAKMKKQRPERGSHGPGELFWYNNWDFNALCTIFEQETGTRVFEEFQKKFALPLGMEDYRVHDGYYHLEPMHSQHPAYPFRMSARDLARLGLLYLRHGSWQDQQVLTKRWVQESTASAFRNSDSTSDPQYAYGYLWWPVVNGPFKSLQMYSARGYGGHAIDVVPRAELVMVHRVDTFWDLDLPLGREKERVETSERFELLKRVLQARVAAPKTDARLTTLPATRQGVQSVAVENRLLNRLSGSYRFEGFTLTVSLSDEGLFVGNSRIGQFKLVPLSPTRFFIEDIAAPIAFELNNQGKPVRVVAELAPGRRFVGLAEPAKGSANHLTIPSAGPSRLTAAPAGTK